jgi:hypothetical protein
MMTSSFFEVPSVLVMTWNAGKFAVELEAPLAQLDEMAAPNHEVCSSRKRPHPD